MTHYWNEYCDFEVDGMNEKGGSWTGGSKMLIKNKLKPTTSLWMGFSISIDPDHEIIYYFHSL